MWYTTQTFYEKKCSCHSHLGCPCRIWDRSILYAEGQSARTRYARSRPDTVVVPRPDDPFPHDQDRDGMADGDEAARGTSDFEFDTDHDGLSDADELTVWHTDPVQADSDGDGYTDAIEAIQGYNPLGSGRQP